MFPVKMNLAKDAGGWVYRTVEWAKAKLGIESVKHDFDGSWYCRPARGRLLKTR